jgi:DNA-binding GntR family transcriptional regulator
MVVPQYVQLLSRLRKQILAGELPAGSYLPSEQELATRFSLNRMTVRRALEELRREGWVEKHQGRRSRVHLPRETKGLLSLPSATDAMETTCHHIHNKDINRPRLVQWPEPFSFDLTESEKEAPAIFFNRLRSVDDFPVMLEHTYVPSRVLPSLLTARWRNGSLFETLASRFKIRVVMMEQILKAVRADRLTADQLKVKVNAPLLLIHRKYTTNRSDFFIYCTLRCNTERYALSNQV